MPRLALILEILLSCPLWFLHAVGETVPETLSGEQRFCQAGRLHQVRFKTKSAASIVSIDDLKGFKDLECDHDGSRLNVIFHDEIHSTALWTRVKLGNVFVTGGEDHGCPLKIEPRKGFLLRWARSAQLNGQAVIIQTSMAQYDEIYDEASISYGSQADASCNEDSLQDAFVCVGVNTDSTCTRAAQPLQIYTNGIVTLTCDDCFAALSGDVFVDLEIKKFQLKSFRAGYSNATINAALDLDMQAQKSWSTGIDKDMPIAGGQSNPIVSFKIGPVPFVFWFDVDQHVVGDAELFASAEARAGIKMKYDIGTSYVAWDPTNHWSHSKTSPQVTFSPAVSGSAQFSGTADFHLIPSIGLHMNQLFQYRLKLDPSISMQVNGDTHSKQICESAGYDVILSTSAALHLNINFLHIHDDQEWGPHVLWQSNGTLSKACAPQSLSTTLVI